MVAQKKGQYPFFDKELFFGFCKFCDRPLGVEGYLAFSPGSGATRGYENGTTLTGVPKAMIS